MNERRERNEQTWDDVEAEFGWLGMRTFGKDITYGIPMDLAMRVTRWLRQPAATFMIRAEPAPDGVKSLTWGTGN